MSEWSFLPMLEAPLKIIDGDRGTNYPKRSEFLNNGHCLFLSAGNVTSVGFSFTECSFITEEADHLLRKGKLERLDSVLTTRGTVGNVAFYSDSIPYKNIRINSGMVIIRPEQNRLDPRYLSCFLNSPVFKDQVSALTTGSAQPQLPIRDIQRVLIPLPSLEAQSAIASVLGALDDKIDLNRRMNETLEQTARALFQDWFVDFGPTKAKMAGQAAYLGDDLWDLFPERLDEAGVPEGWATGKLELILERLKVGKLYDQKSVLPYGEVPVFDQGKSGIIGYHNNVPNIKASPKRRVAIFANHTCFQKIVDYNFSTIQNVIPYVGVDYPTEWVYYATLGKQEFEEYKGHWPSLMVKKTILPSHEVTVAFEKLIDPLLAKKSSNDQGLITLAQTRDLLLPKLMSGELRVRDAEALVAEQV